MIWKKKFDILKLELRAFEVGHKFVWTQASILWNESRRIGSHPMFQQPYQSAQFGDIPYLVLLHKEGRQMWYRLGLSFFSCYLLLCVGFYFHQQKKLVVFLFNYVVFVKSFLEHFITWYLDLQTNFKFLYFIIVISKRF